MEAHWLSLDEMDSLPVLDCECKPSDPVRKYGDKWYHHDETWAGTFGPFDTKFEAEVAVRDYANTI